jgi:hypothetical protein
MWRENNIQPPAAAARGSGADQSINQPKSNQTSKPEEMKKKKKKKKKKRRSSGV